MLHAATLGRSCSTVGTGVTSATGDFMSEMAHRLKERRAKAVSEARFSLPFNHSCEIKIRSKQIYIMLHVAVVW